MYFEMVGMSINLRNKICFLYIYDWRDDTMAEAYMPSIVRTMVRNRAFSSAILKEGGYA